MVRAVRQLCGGAYARWQDLLDRKDDPGLVAFAASPDALSFRSTLVFALGRDLRWRGQYPAARDLLRAAVDRYPRRRLVALRPLPRLLRPPRPPDYAEALRHVSAASVLQPDNAAFHLCLGTLLRQARVARAGRCRLPQGDRPATRTPLKAAHDLNHCPVADHGTEVRANVQWLDGEWERVAATEGAPVREAVRVVLECKAVARGNAQSSRTTARIGFSDAHAASRQDGEERFGRGPDCAPS